MSSAPDKTGTFALIGPPSDSGHLYEVIDWYRASKGHPVKRFGDPATLLKFLEWLPPFAAAKFHELRAASGRLVDGLHVWCPIMPEMVATMGEGSEFRRHLQERVIQACTVAGREGATIAALGAFSSIVVVGMEDVVAVRSGIAVTSGNTFTARLTIAGVERAAELIGVSLPDARVAMLGASGDIGRGVCRWLAQEVGHLTMAARNLPRLEAFAEELRVGARATVEVSPDNREAVREADIVIGAAISPTPIIQAEDVQPGAIVCDVGYPKNISVEMDKRPDVFSFLGGMSRPPFVLDFGYNVNLPSFDVLYGCLSEAIVLALEGRAEIFSAGRGNILPEKMDEIWELAQKHGFDVAPFHSGSRALDADDVARVRSAIRERHRRGAK